MVLLKSHFIFEKRMSLRAKANSLHHELHELTQIKTIQAKPFFLVVNP